MPSLLGGKASFKCYFKEALFFFYAKIAAAKTKSENAKNKRRRGCDKKSLELVHRDFYGASRRELVFDLSKLCLCV